MPLITPKYKYRIVCPPIDVNCEPGPGTVAQLFDAIGCRFSTQASSASLRPVRSSAVLSFSKFSKIMNFEAARCALPGAGISGPPGAGTCGDTDWGCGCRRPR